MSVPFGPVALSLEDITRQLRSTFAQFTDARRGKNTRYTLVDAGLSAFAVFFMQSPSFFSNSHFGDFACFRLRRSRLEVGHERPRGGWEANRHDLTRFEAVEHKGH